MLLSCKIRSFLFLATMLLAVALGGCSSKATTKVEARPASAGQELQDLKDAHEKGLISDREYERMRKEVVRREGGQACGVTGLEAAPLMLWLLWRKRK